MLINDKYDTCVQFVTWKSKLNKWKRLIQIENKSILYKTSSWDNFYEILVNWIVTSSFGFYKQIDLFPWQRISVCGGSVDGQLTEYIFLYSVFFFS